MKKVFPYVLVLVIISIAIYLSKKHFNKMEVKNFTLDDAKKAITAVKNKYGVDMARIVEKLFRFETKHFTSGQYKQTGSAGMVEGHWSDVPKDSVSAPLLIHNTYGEPDLKYIVWNSPTDFAIFLANYIKKYNGNFARWNSTDPIKQKIYSDSVLKVKSQFV